MEEFAAQLDEVRSELVQLLRDYPFASEHDRDLIYERCELLGGEIQELVGLVKLAIRDTNRQAAIEAPGDLEYLEEIDRLSGESLAAIHAAGEEVNIAVRLLRDSRAEIGEEQI
jgi:hypothetical protein